ncbi:PREDICTED: olfactory receptor-like protein OLF2, partial [Galeopterus variegatus]|uniref:Olfactory receptor n=1 Tax=Galeopterus variegatus TaxID=482537 RepID=A0ABM0Q012_GALVR
MIILIKLNSQIHTPVYFFLSHLSFSDLCYSTAIGPRMPVGFIAKDKSIPVYGCALQFWIFCIFADSECLLLAMTAFERYKAISHPLLYTVNTSNRMCSLLRAGAYMVGIMGSLINTALIFHLCFCGSNEINHFLCDVPPLLLLSCSDTQVNELAKFIISGLLVSYCYIIPTVIRICSAEGRCKAFSTCTSHLTALAILQGKVLFIYFQPSSTYSLDQDKMASLFSTLVSPMLNPLIYSLWNKDVKEDLEKLKNQRYSH